jgi:DNA helicase IV
MEVILSLSLLCFMILFTISEWISKSTIIRLGDMIDDYETEVSGYESRVSSLMDDCNELHIRVNDLEDLVDTLQDERASVVRWIQSAPPVVQTTLHSIDRKVPE